ncbi:hypothetical protein C8R44DRAFT_871027 [Mycena epipterygia]|nr:hypothetical protein C8R44DRAFT_871027 [Mycena epipterygia]
MAAPDPAPKVTVIEINDETEDKSDKTKKQGPKNTPRDHWHPPRAVKYDGKLCWEFKCKHCTTSYTFPCTIGRDDMFKDELPQLPLGNLATYLKKHGGPTIPIPGNVRLGVTQHVSAASAKIIEDYICQGKLHPAVNPTQKGFLTVFSAWILEDDLPFTTDETSGIHWLFE